MSAEVPTASRPTFLRRNIEIIIAVLLGLIATFTAYASFQSSLYDGNQAQAYTNGTNQRTEAESIYLEANQQFVQDTQLFERLTDLRLDIANPDPAISAAAQEKYDVISFQSVSDEFGAAIEWADAQNEADAELYYSPLDNEDYQDFLFASYYELKEQADATIAEGNQANVYGDRLTLTTVLMAISLFLLGIAAVVGTFRTRLVLGGISIVIFLVAAGIMLAVPACHWWLVRACRQGSPNYSPDSLHRGLRHATRFTSPSTEPLDRRVPASSTKR